MLAQILDRGEIAVWRDVFRRAKTDARLRQIGGRARVIGAGPKLILHKHIDGPSEYFAALHVVLGRSKVRRKRPWAASACPGCATASGVGVGLAAHPATSSPTSAATDHRITTP